MNEIKNVVDNGTDWRLLRKKNPEMLGSIWTYQQMKKKSKIDGLEIWDLKSVYFELIFLCYFLLTNNYCCGKNKLEEIKNRLLEIKIGFVEVKIAGKFEVVNGLTSWSYLCPCPSASAIRPSNTIHKFNLMKI